MYFSRLLRRRGPGPCGMTPLGRTHCASGASGRGIPCQPSSWESRFARLPVTESRESTRNVARLPLRSERRNRDLAGIDSLGRSRSLIIGEKENLVLPDRAADGSPELVLVKRAARGRKIVAGIEIRVAQEFEDIAVECVGAGLRDHVDLASAELAVFRVEVAGENPELGDGIQVGNDRRAHVDVLFDVASIQHKAVGEFPLAVDRDGAGIQIAGGRKCADAHILAVFGCQRGDGNDAGLKGKQVREAAAIERHGRHLLAGDDLAHLGVDGFDVRGRFGNGYGSVLSPMARDASTTTLLSTSITTPVRRRGLNPGRPPRRRSVQRASSGMNRSPGHRW